MVMLLLALLAAPIEPQDAATLRLVGRFGDAQACPVAADTALTSAHVLDPRPFDKDVPLYPYRYSTADEAESGLLKPAGISVASDLGIVAPMRPFARHYTVAPGPPAPGDRVTFYGYDFRSGSKAFASRRYDARVRRIVAGNLVLDKAPDFGTSGSCVFNEAGEVLAVISWAPMKNVGVAVGVWPPWMEDEAALQKQLEELAAEARKKAEQK